MASLSALIHGTKPQVAPFEPTDPIAELQKLLSGEVSSWDDITKIGNLYQDYMQSAYEKEIPGFADILRQGGADTASLLSEAAPLIKGELPPDVLNQVFRQSAFENLGSGLLGSPAGGANQARQLGLTSLEAMNQGANLLTAGGNAAQRWQGIASGMILPPTANMYSPQWFSQFMAEQNAARQATQQYKYNVAAAPDPAWADRAKLLATYGGMALGGGIGGGRGSNASSAIGQSAQWPAPYQSNIAPNPFDNMDTSSFYGPSAPSSTNPDPFIPTGDYKSVIPPTTSNFNFYPTWG